MFLTSSLTAILTLGMFASFSSSPNYQLKSYGIGPGATNSSSSTTYKSQSNVGEQASGSTSGSTLTSNNGAVNAEQLNVPPAPTLSNGSGTYYNKLNFIINTASNPTDTTFSVAVSTNGFVTTNYVQADGTLNSTAVYQTYSAWGSGTGTLAIGLAPSTSYAFKVNAKQGLFTNTKYGAPASISTVSPSLTFSLTPNTTNLGNLLPGSVVSSASLSFTYNTNATSGGAVYVAGQYSGLYSSRLNYTIPAYTGDISTQSQGFGVQATSPTQTSGGPFVIASPYGGIGDNVGTESSSPQQILYSLSPIIGAAANANIKAVVSSTTPSSSDYSEILTFTAAANF